MGALIQIPLLVDKSSLQAQLAIEDSSWKQTPIFGK